MTETVLDKYGIEVVVDSSKVGEGLSDVTKKVDSFENKLKTTNKTTNTIIGSFKRFTTSLTGLATGFLGVGAIIGAGRSAINNATALKDLSEALNVNMEQLELWGNSVQRSGGSAEGFRETVKSMTASLAEFALKGKSRVAPFFQELGIRMTDSRGKARSFLDILPELADSFQKLGKEKSFGIGQKLGLDTGTIQLLQKGRGEIDKLLVRFKKLGTTSTEDAEKIAQFKDQMEDLGIVFKNLSGKALGFVLPVLKKVLQAFEKLIDFATKRKEIFVATMIALGVAIATYIVPPLVAAAAAAITAFAPFYALGAVLGILGFIIGGLVEDFNAFSKGQKSLIGELVKKYPLLGDAIKTVITIFKGGKQIISSFLNVLSDLLKEAPRLGPLFMGIGDAIVASWDVVYNIIKKTIDFILSAIDLVGSGLKNLSEVFGGENTINSYIKEQDAKKLQATTRPFASSFSQSLVNTKNNNEGSTNNVDVRTGNITIQTQATDAKGIAGGIGTLLSKNISQAINGMDNGVRS